jgi:hypothetical protein
VELADVLGYDIIWQKRRCPSIFSLENTDFIE